MLLSAAQWLCGSQSVLAGMTTLPSLVAYSGRCARGRSSSAEPGLRRAFIEVQLRRDEVTL